MHRPGMAVVFVSVSCFLLSHFQLGIGGPVFLSAEDADIVLQRHKRANDGVFEEFREGNLERECNEEMCNVEEAREIFEDHEQTMEFWVRYIDGDQCESSPCLNQGSCKDRLGFHTCHCLPGFTGKNCEIALTKRCDLNNGDCMHFCELMPTFGARCSCATGYKLMENGEDCEPEVEFPCGKTALMLPTVARSLNFENTVVRLHVSNTPHSRAEVTASAPPSTTMAQPSTTMAQPSTTIAPPSTTEALPTTTPYPGTTAVYPQTSESEGDPSTATLFPPFYNETDPPTKAPEQSVTRIVGGVAAIQGEIPWQVGLVLRSSNRIFCGGSILDKLWVITAAHCLKEAQGPFVVRVGELHIYVDDMYEADHEVLQQYIHPYYNFTEGSHNHDIALLHLKTPITFSIMVRPICIGPKSFTENLMREASPAMVSGWGRMLFEGATPTTLQKVEVPFTEQTKCKDSSSSHISRYMFCAGYDVIRKDACQGDSGGPHANKIHNTWFLTGIVSWGEKCALEGKYGVYTRMSQYYHWIQHVMGHNGQAMHGS